MQLLPSFSLFFSWIVVIICISFKGCRATECRLDDNDASKVAYTITVDHSGGSGCFKTIQDAINSIPSGNDQWIRIHARQGIYLEKISIPQDKPCIVLEGEGRDGTIISWDDHDKTDTSATFTSQADNFVAKDIMFMNTFNRGGVDATVDIKSYLAGIDATGEIKQALAARIYGDKSAFYRCGFIGFQDTLWDVQGRHYFKSCYIEGAIDFIFGGGQSYYEDSQINVTAGLLSPHAGYITAQGRQSPNDPSGFVFKDGVVFGSGQVYLGRAYGPFSRVIFYGTNFDTRIVPQGWDAWNFQGQEGYLTYGEVQCQGSDESKRVTWEKQPRTLELSKFTRSSYIDQEGWIARQP